jgi:hypothetical protein
MPKKTYPQNWFFQNSTSLCWSGVSRHAHQCLGCGDSITLTKGIAQTRRGPLLPRYLILRFAGFRICRVSCIWFPNSWIAGGILPFSSTHFSGIQ